MPTVGAQFKGKAGSPSFYKPAPKAPATANSEKHWPLIIGGALAGAAILLFMRTKNSSYGTGPVLSVYPDTGADQSQIQNMLGTLQVLLKGKNNTGQANPPTDGQNQVPPPSDNHGGNGGTGTLPGYSVGDQLPPVGSDLWNALFPPASGVKTASGTYYRGVASGQQTNPTPGSLEGYKGPAGGLPTSGPWVPSTGISEKDWYANQVVPSNQGPNSHATYDIASGDFNTWVPPGQDTGPAVSPVSNF